MSFFNDPLTQHGSFHLSLRAILGAVFVAALVAALLTPVYPVWSYKHTVGLLSALSGTALGAVGFFLAMLYRRRSLRTRCGELLLRLPLKERSGHIWFIIGSVFGFFLCVSLEFLVVTTSRHEEFTITWISPIAGVLLTNLVLSVYWQRANISAELCQHGVIFRGSNYVPWTDFKRYRWTFGDRFQLVMRFNVIDVCPPPEFRELTDEILRAHLPCERGPNGVTNSAANEHK